MRICLIVEGAYPYVIGGVSTWIHSLISNMPEHEFILYLIGSRKSNPSQLKYTLPLNVIEVKEIYLNDYSPHASKKEHQIRMSSSQKAIFLEILGLYENTSWDAFFALLQSKKFCNIDDFLNGKAFFELVVDLCKAKYAALPFSEVFMTLRSIVFPLLLSLHNEIPKADLYHSVSAGFAGIIGSFAKYLFGKPFILTEHGIYFRERKEEIHNAEWIKEPYKDIWIEHYHKLSACAYHYSDQVTTLFKGNRNFEIEQGCDPDKIIIIPNGVNIKEYSELINIPFHAGKPIRLGAIVRIVPIKNIKMMIRSFALVKREIPDAELYIIGPIDEDERYYSECLQLVDHLQVKDIIFTGDVEIKEYISQIQILMLTSNSEGMPFAVLEGMACSKPYITTDVGSCRDLLYGLDDNLGPSGILVPIDDCNQLKHAIIKLCIDQKLREEMGRIGQKRVCKYYSSENFIKGYQELYENYKEREQWQE